MSTYARIVDGKAVDVVSTPPTLAERFHPEWLSRQTFYPAPADTREGRPGTANPDGSVTWGANPPAPPAPQKPAISDIGSFKGIVRAKAKLLMKINKHSEAIALLKTIGE